MVTRQLMITQLQSIPRTHKQLWKISQVLLYHLWQINLVKANPVYFPALINREGARRIQVEESQKIKDNGNQRNSKITLS